MNIKSTAVALALVAGAGWASAQEDVSAPINLVLMPTVGGGLLGTTPPQMESGLFVDTYVISPGPFTGAVSVTLDGTESVNFFAAILGDQTFSFMPESQPTNDFSFTAMVNNVSPLTLTVLGFSGLTGFDGNGIETGQALTPQAGSYTVQVSVAAIPEPETYALMLAGLAFVGMWARRRRHG